MTSFVNHYECPCGHKWSDVWSCQCNDRCPECNKECEPTSSDEEGQVVEAKGYLSLLYLDYVNNWLTIETFAEHHGLSVPHCATLIQLASETHYLAHPEA